jgi:hypothetical protein
MKKQRVDRKIRKHAEKQRSAQTIQSDSSESVSGGDDDGNSDVDTSIVDQVKLELKEKANVNVERPRAQPASLKPPLNDAKAKRRVADKRNFQASAGANIKSEHIIRGISMQTVTVAVDPGDQSAVFFDKSTDSVEPENNASPIQLTTPQCQYMHTESVDVEILSDDAGNVERTITLKAKAPSLDPLVFLSPIWDQPTADSVVSSAAADGDCQLQVEQQRHTLLMDSSSAKNRDALAAFRLLKQTKVFHDFLTHSWRRFSLLLSGCKSCSRYFSFRTCGKQLQFCGTANRRLYNQGFADGLGQEQNL